MQPLCRGKSCIQLKIFQFFGVVLKDTYTNGHNVFIWRQLSGIAGWGFLEEMSFREFAGKYLYQDLGKQQILKSP
jgi:hypothetical protein